MAEKMLIQYKPLNRICPSSGALARRLASSSSYRRFSSSRWRLLAASIRSFSSRSRRASYSSSVSSRGAPFAASFGFEGDRDCDRCLDFLDFFLSLCFRCLECVFCRLRSSELLSRSDRLREREGDTDDEWRCFFRRLRPLPSSSLSSLETLSAAVGRRYQSGIGRK